MWHISMLCFANRCYINFCVLHTLLSARLVNNFVHNSGVHQEFLIFGGADRKAMQPTFYFKNSIIKILS